MHRIIKSYLDDFVESHALHGIEEATQFEMFVNYLVLSGKASFDFDLDDVTTSENDNGIDGLAVIIDEELSVSDEDAKSLFSAGKKNRDVELVFIQSKRSESYDLGDFLKFKESILSFITSEDYDPKDSLQLEARNTFDVVLNNVPKIRGGKPRLSIQYVTTGQYKRPAEFEEAKSKFFADLDDIGFFSEVEIQFIGRDELTSLWNNIHTAVQAELEMFSQATLPTLSKVGIAEAYLAVVKAKDYVESLLITEDGGLQNHVFVENVRAFLGTDNPVNASIAKTLQDKSLASLFPVLNNGITIVSPDVRVQGNRLHLENYQIINGCQTSNMLFEMRDELDDSIMVNLKIIETSNENIFSELVRATNSQTKVEETQFYSLRPIVKKAEAYFDTYEESEGRLYLERRERQFIGKSIPAVRTFSLNNATKCVAALFCQRPELAYRYQKQMYDQLADYIFSDDTKEIVFYTACLALYRFNLLSSNADIPQNMKKFKWHVIVVVSALIAGKDIPRLNSGKMEAYCKKLIRVFSKTDQETKDYFNKAISIVCSIDNITNDRLKRQAILEEMLSKIQDA